MLEGMTRAWLRRTFTLLLGVVFAASMSVSTVQATEMAVKMATASSVDIAQHNKCPDCDHGNDGMKPMNCGLVVCTAQGVASLPQTFIITVSAIGVDVPNPLQPALVGWVHAPDPYPPRRSSLG